MLTKNKITLATAIVIGSASAAFSGQDDVATEEGLCIHPAWMWRHRRKSRGTLPRSSARSGQMSPSKKVRFPRSHTPINRQDTNGIAVFLETTSTSIPIAASLCKSWNGLHR
jgi:hypothetical protein